MSSPAAARPLHPFIALIWGVFLFWSAWLGAVWLLRIGPGWLGYSPEEQITKLPNDELWQAVELLAAKAELVWLALALACLHLFVTGAHGLRTARAWLGISAGLALAFSVLNALAGAPFGWVSFGELLTLKVPSWKTPGEMADLRVFGVTLGWVVLWVVLVLAAREGVLRLRPRLPHAAATAWTAVVVALTLLNLEPIMGAYRGGWHWHGGQFVNLVGFRWWTPLGWLGCAFTIAFLLREKSVISAAARRSLRPLLLLGIINTLALASHFRNALQ